MAKENEVKCEKCKNSMHQIGPFASIKAEGEPAKKWDGCLEFECINKTCENLGNIIKIKQ